MNAIIKLNNLKNFKKYFRYLASVGIIFSANIALAQSSTSTNGGLGQIAKNITNSISDIAVLIISISILAGLGFGVASAFKFKQHKDNPTQVPLGQPLTLLAIAVMLLWLPYILQQAGATLTGGNTDKNVKINELPSFLGDQKGSGAGN
jgi:intracellular multiplication protein IcmD